MSAAARTLLAGGEVTESIEAWWARRQFSKGVDVPYAVGTYRADWQRYPVLIRQYHPYHNGMITLTQIPPAADVWLTWECDVGHTFIATPTEQRNRPGRERRKSSWCPGCLERAIDRPMLDPVRTAPPPPPPAQPPRPCGHPLGSRRNRSRPCQVCLHAAAGAGALPVGTAFVSQWAPAVASAVEADLRQKLLGRLDFDASFNAIRVGQPFFTHLEVWPDIIIDELRVAIELDTVGRHGLEHVGKREETDKRKDRLTRAAGWEVVRLRLGKLQAIGPFDVCASGVTSRVVDQVVERLGDIRGEMFVSAYSR